MTSPVNCFQTMVWTQFAVTVHGYVTKHTHNIICLEKVDNSEHKNHMKTKFDPACCYQSN